jgi:hypothetical protein
LLRIHSLRSLTAQRIRAAPVWKMVFCLFLLRRKVEAQWRDELAPEVQIAGTTAIHLRHDRSPQSYAFDRYYFARAGQLYMILIGHTGDKEDWTLYDHFLQSFQFD